VEADSPRRIIAFLRSILPLKPVAELYISLGLNKHGKTELYRDLQRHLVGSDDLFEIAEGARGMVMLVFTLPSHDVVFKMIRDRFAYPKTTTRRQVMDRYRLVFKRDRVGRLVDAQEFKQLTFQRQRFAPDLLRELQEQAAGSIRLVGDQVVIEHLYSERRMTPLNIYVREAAPAAAQEAILDYGRAIKELAAANIFPGDFLLKNFGVTRHGRVVFYDYDELCLVTDCVFREMPPPRNPEEEMESETWFPVGEHDIFPEEFRTFLGLGESLRDLFARHHGDLFTVDFWQRLQDGNRHGEIMEFFPYPQEVRLRPEAPAQPAP
jgi:isocitrate dehydrogenase kinase/phosphatase